MLGDQSIHAIASLRQLRQLELTSLHHCNFSEASFRALGGVAGGIEYLNLSNNQVGVGMGVERWFIIRCSLPY